MSEQKFMSNLNGYEIRDAYARENILTEEDALIVLSEIKIIDPVSLDGSTVFINTDNKIFIL